METVGAIATLLVAIPLLLVLAVVLFVVYFLLGWAVILMWLFGVFDFNYIVGLAIGVYCTAAGAAVLMYLLQPDLTGLPRALRFLAAILPAPLQRQPAGQVDMPELGGRLRKGLVSPFTKIEMKFRARRYDRAAEKLRTEGEYLQAQADLARAAQAFNRAHLRADEAEKARDRDGQ